MKITFGTLALIACCATSFAASNTVTGHAEYDASCKSCHGATGVAKPAVAKMMKVTMRPLGSAEVQAQSDADLKKIVTEGKGKMKPAAKSVNPGDVVAYIRTLQQHP